MNKKIIEIVLLFVAIFAALIFAVSPAGRKTCNELFGTSEVKKTDAETIERTCDDMLKTYEADKAVYEEYKAKNLLMQYEVELMEQARLRANKTAWQYNEYIHKWFMVFDELPKELETLK